MTPWDPVGLPLDPLGIEIKDQLVDLSRPIWSFVQDLLSRAKSVLYMKLISKSIYLDPASKSRLLTYIYCVINDFNHTFEVQNMGYEAFQITLS